jgi:hypothetical protein
MEEHIHIVPARAEVIYVPRYDPTIVYVSRPYTYPVSFISFGAAYPAGSWLAYDIDWRFRTFWVVPPPQRVVYWQARPDWRHRYHVTPVRPGWREPYWHVWQPVVSRPRYAAPPRSVASRSWPVPPPPSRAYAPPLPRPRHEDRPATWPTEARERSRAEATRSTATWTASSARPADADEVTRPERAWVRPGPSPTEGPNTPATAERRPRETERPMTERWQHRSAPATPGRGGDSPARGASRARRGPAPADAGTPHRGGLTASSKVRRSRFALSRALPADA